ncbi:hypothetical protein MOX02_42470 [Methylobacterium oxalidis]|uniref:Uncharacterized protein n=1 Tax=Methylobacterium oxalidis TaxID=944322 RepID=A0A512J8N9_9HYPH|nr:hypothetical protein MOX02_42470 [Methylobacterium oxalidis]GJE33817.1 hypothetical protein LDDCCGHA_4020 [Methylobacterium oxalidis]GLS62989.1 hypothetical protein GCM10007888_13700 [Methylobacterium oxalidis]
MVLDHRRQGVEAQEEGVEPLLVLVGEPGHGLRGERHQPGDALPRPGEPGGDLAGNGQGIGEQPPFERREIPGRAAGLSAPAVVRRHSGRPVPQGDEVDRAQRVARLPHEHVHALLADQVGEVRPEAEFGGERGLRRRLRDDVKVDVATPPRVVDAGSEQQHARAGAEMPSGTGQDRVSLALGQPHRATRSRPPSP